MQNKDKESEMALLFCRKKVLTNFLNYDINNKVRWPLGQAVKTPPSQGGIMGSIPVGVTKKDSKIFYFAIFFQILSIQHKLGAKWII